MILAIAAIAVLVATACSSSEPPATSAPSSPPGSGAPPATAPGLDALPHVAVTITQVDDRSAVRVEGSATVPAGLVVLDIRNDADDDDSGAGRGAVVLGVAPGASRADLEAALVSAPERIDGLAVALGGAAPLAAGASQEVIVALDPGRYYIAPTGPGALGSITSSTIGAARLTAFDVGPAVGGTGGSTVPVPVPTTRIPAPANPVGTVPLGTVIPAPAPPAQADLVAQVTTGEVVLSDYDVELPEEMRSGWYHVINRGQQPHELAVVSVDDGHSGSEVIDALEQRALAARTTVGTTPPGSAPSGSTPGSPPDGQAGSVPPGTVPADVRAQLHGGLASLSPGAEAWVHLELDNGGYVAICDRPALLADAGQSAPDGLPHHTHGMAVFFRVG